MSFKKALLPAGLTASAIGLAVYGSTTTTASGHTPDPEPLPAVATALECAGPLIEGSSFMTLPGSAGSLREQTDDLINGDLIPGSTANLDVEVTFDGDRGQAAVLNDGTVIAVITFTAAEGGWLLEGFDRCAG